MTDYREQAIKDVAEASHYGAHKIEWTVNGSFNPNPLIFELVRYAVAQREARLRLEAAILLEHGKWWQEQLIQRAAALEADKEE